MPEIISQSKTIYACEGDLVTLKVITDKIYNFQWYTALKDYEKGSYNFTELVGENSYSLTLNPVLESSNPENLYYFLRIVSYTDTLWSAEIKLKVTSLVKPVDDTILARKLPALIRISPEAYFPEADLIWSTGDTTHYPPFRNYTEFWHFGKSWVTMIKRGCSRTDTFQVLQCPSILHITEDKNKLQCWCADTVYIERDVIMDGGITIIPGTTVKFGGNYRLQSRFIDASGYKEDSIYILGNTDPVLRSNQGYLRTWSDGYNVTGNSFDRVVIKNMSCVDQLKGAGHINFSGNDTLNLYEVNNCIIGHNKRVEIFYSINNSTLYGNDSIFGIPVEPREATVCYFYCLRNTFVSNKTGLIIGNWGRNSQYTYSFIWNNIFENNTSTAITVSTPLNYIDQNIFKFNISQTGSSVIKGDFKGIMPECSNCPFVLFNFRNNTLYNNNGRNCIGIYNTDSIVFTGNILNNVFWDHYAETPFDLKIQNSEIREFNITNNSYRGDETSLELPENNNFRIADNLYEIYPEFYDTVNSVFTLRESSALIDAGTDTVFVYPSRFVTKDHNEFSRKIGNAIDIGAFEFHRIAPLAFRYITPDTFVCRYDLATLKAFPEEAFSNELYTIRWYKNGVILPAHMQDECYLNLSNFLDIGGYYSVALSNSVDTLWSNPIHVDYDVSPAFIIDDFPEKEVCMGLGVKFQMKTKSRHTPVFEWLSIKNGQLPSKSDTLYLDSPVESDTLYVTATNMCDSVSSGPLILMVFPLPEPDLGKDTCIYTADSLLLDAGSGYISYSWNTGEQRQHIYAHAGDTVQVTVTDWHSCKGSDTIVINSHVIQDLPMNRALTFNLYPNPATKKLFVKVPDNSELPCLFSIITSDGKLIFEKEIYNTEELVVDVSKYSKGTYYIRIHSASAAGSGKFVVM